MNIKHVRDASYRNQLKYAYFIPVTIILDMRKEAIQNLSWTNYSPSWTKVEQLIRNHFPVQQKRIEFCEIYADTEHKKWYGDKFFRKFFEKITM